jgi:hypothetical protein
MSLRFFFFTRKNPREYEAGTSRASSNSPLIQGRPPLQPVIGFEAGDAGHSEYVHSYGSRMVSPECSWPMWEKGWGAGEMRCGFQWAGGEGDVCGTPAKYRVIQRRIRGKEARSPVPSVGSGRMHIELRETHSPTPFGVAYPPSLRRLSQVAHQLVTII